MRWHSIGLVAAGLVIAGCEGQQREFEEPSTSERAMGAPPAAEAPAGRPAPAAGAVPEVLEKAEETAEDVQEDIVESKWDDAAEKTRELQSLSDSLKQTGAPASDLTAYDSAVATLAQKVQGRDQMGAALAANEASRAAIAMMAPYNPRVPVDVGYMDVEARNAIYHAQGGDWTRAEQAARDLSSSYSKVQAHVAQQKPELDQKLRSEIERLNAAITQKDVAATRSAAEQVLDDIDDIEDTFKGSNQRTRSMQPGQSGQGTQGTQSTTGTQR